MPTAPERTSSTEAPSSKTGYLCFLILSIPVSGSLLFALFYFPVRFPVSDLIRAAQISYLLLLGACWLSTLYFLVYRKGGVDQLIQKFEKQLQNPSRRNGAAFLMICTCLIGSIAFFLPIYTNGSPLDPYLMRLSPLAAWFACSSFTILTIIRELRAREHRTIRKWRDVLYGFVSLGVVLVSTSFAAWKIGSRAQTDLLTSTISGTPEVPILTSQLVYVVVFAIVGNLACRLISMISPRSFNRGKVQRFLETAIVITVWIVAAIVWSGTHLEDNFFVRVMQLPNQETFPHSDAALHDLHAQNLLIGEGLTRGDRLVVRRPLYSMILAILHSIAGQSYDRTVQLQILLLSFFPVIIYLLAAHLSNRFTGLIAAGLVIFREKNAISLSGVVNVSNSKLLMSDLPTALAISVFTLFLVIYLENPDRRKLLPLILGGILGLTMLVRLQVVLLSLVVLGFIAIQLFRGWSLRRVCGAGLIFLAGIVLAIMPWVFRNYLKTGSFMIESTSQLRLIAERLSPDPAEYNPDQLPEESEAEFSQRMVTDAVQNILSRPFEIMEMVQLNYAFNLYASALQLPISALSVELEPFVRETGYWHTWDGRFRSETILPLAMNLGVVGLGLSVLISRHRLAGSAPLFVFLILGLTTALVGSSGWRFILPADWVLILSFAAGLGIVARNLTLNVPLLAQFEPVVFDDAHLKSPSIADGSRASNRHVWLAAGLIFSFACLLPISEVLAAPRYKIQTAGEIHTTLNKSAEYLTLPTEMRREFEQLFLSPGNTAYWGRAMYPSYYPKGMGESGGDWPSFEARTCSRVGFLLLGPVYFPAILPDDSGELTFPNGADTLVVGRVVGDVFQSEAVLLLFDDRAVALFSSQPGIPCLK